MVGGVALSFTQMKISQVPASAAMGLQLRTLLVCHAAWVTSGVQGVVPARRRKSAYCRPTPVPPLAVAVQVSAVPWAADAGLMVPLTVRGATTLTWPGL